MNIVRKLTDEERAIRRARRKNKRTNQEISLLAPFFQTTPAAEAIALKRIDAVTAAMFRRIVEFEAKCAVEARSLQEECACEMSPDQYRDALGKLRRLQAYPAMRLPVEICDYWHCLLKGL